MFGCKFSDLSVVFNLSISRLVGCYELLLILFIGLKA
jgi:hypothetical protein